MVQRLISFDDERPGLGLPDDVQARMDARYSGSGGGVAPHIGENGNWWIGETDTGTPAQGDKGDPGQDGQDGLTPHVGANGNWWVGDTDTGVRAQGPKGDPGDGAGGGTGDVLWSELNPVLDGKAPVSHVHTISQVSGLRDELDGKASSGHSHTVASITGLQDELDGKAAADHQHVWGDVTGKPDVYPPESHTHSEYATTAQMEARTPEIRVVTTIPTSPTPGVVYLRFG